MLRKEKKMKRIFDMFNNELKINDEVEFIIEHKPYKGIINFISENGMIKINSLPGEYRRYPNNVSKIIR
jgi:hypothetical protein